MSLFLLSFFLVYGSLHAYALLKAVAATRTEAIGQVRLIVNMVAHRRDGQRVHARIAENETDLGRLEKVVDGHAHRSRA
jgi:hypothetical protein